MPKVRVFVDTVGVLVLNKKTKERGTRKTTHFDSMPFAGIRQIISELHNIGIKTDYVSIEDIDKYEYNIYSIISSFEYINLLSHSDILGKRKSKLILGGAGLCNIMPLTGIADIFHIGRGENCIENILNEIPQKGTIYKHDQLVENSVEVKEPESLIKTNGYNETSVGCNAKCFFCQYAWKNGTFNTCNSYTSGSSLFEDYLTTLNWDMAQKGAVSAIDGLQEATRKKVNKKITNKEIVDKITEALKTKREKRLSLKLFNIVGYPWEKAEQSITDEFRECLAIAAKKGKYKNQIKIVINHNHFSPMPLTPMEMLPVNTMNFRDMFLANKTIYDDGNINAWHYDYSASPLYAMEQAIINRALSPDDLGIQILASKKYNRLDAKTKVKILKENCKALLSEQDEIPCKYIKRPYAYKHISQHIECNSQSTGKSDQQDGGTLQPPKLGLNHFAIIPQSRII
jgi:hypothetical protein